MCTSRFCLILMLLLAVKAVSAAACGLPANTDTSLLVSFSRNMDGCLTFDANKHDLTKQIHALFSQTGSANQEKGIQALGVIETALQQRFTHAATQASQQGKQLLVRVTDLRETLMRTDLPAKDLKSNWKWRQRDLEVDGLEFLDFTVLLTEEKCPTGQSWSQTCRSNFDDASLMGASIHLVNAAIDRFLTEFREQVQKNRELRMNMWDSYYDDLTFQYPWEMYLNNIVIDKADTRETIDGNKQGFRPLPTSKLVVLHPEIALVYDNQLDDKIDEVLNVEVIGFERFSFHGTSGRVKDNWGMSLMASYLQDKEGEGDWRPGLLLKYKGYSLGVSDNDDETAFILNLNLSQLLFRVEDDARKYKIELQQQVDNWKTEHGFQ